MLHRVIVSTLKQAKRLIVIVVGFTVLLAGVAMIVLRAPAIVVIPAGLAILATEFLWARRLLQRVKAKATQIASRVKGNRTNKSDGTVSSHPQEQRKESL